MAVVLALKRSRSDQAIRLLHELRGIPLDEARAVIEAQLRRAGKAKGSILSLAGLPFAVSSALRKGDRAEAIRLLREQGGLGPENAEKTVAEMEAQGLAGEGPSAPGEVPRRSGGFWIVVLVVVAALLGYWYFRRAG